MKIDLEDTEQRGAFVAWMERDVDCDTLAWDYINALLAERRLIQALSDQAEIARDSVAALALEMHRESSSVADFWSADPWQMGYAAGKSRNAATANTLLSAIANMLERRRP